MRSGCLSVRHHLHGAGNIQLEWYGEVRRFDRTADTSRQEFTDLVDWRRKRDARIRSVRARAARNFHQCHYLAGGRLTS